MIEIIRTHTALARHLPAWRRLAGTHGSPMQDPDWCLAGLRALHPEAPPHIVLYREGGDLRAVAPLVRVRRHGVTWLELIGSARLHEPGDFLFETPGALAELLAGVRSLGLPLILGRIPADGPLSRLPGLRPGRILKRRIRSSSAAWIDTRGDVGQLENGVSARRRYELRRKRKRCEREGPVRFEIFCPTPENCDAVWRQAVRVEAAGWKSRKGSALAQQPALDAFFRQWLAAMCARGTARFCFMYIGDQCVAMHVGVEHARRLWIMKLGYDEAWGRCSPGILLADATIRHCYARNLEGYEFLGSFEPWQAHWPVQQHALGSLIVYPLSIRGLAGLGAHIGHVLRNRLATA